MRLGVSAGAERKGCCCGERDIYRWGTSAGEPWQSGFEEGEVAAYLDGYNMQLVE